MKIYTKTGDEGQTGLLGGKRVAKSDPRIEAVGNLDELNAWLGLIGDLFAARSEEGFPANAVAPIDDGLPVILLRRIQERLFTAGALLACEPGQESKMKLPELVPGDVKALETAIDQMEATLPQLKNFILPGGHLLVSNIHVARGICRKAERSVVSLNEPGSGVPPLVIQYLNRLSDFLFVFARATGHQLNVPEIPWIPEK